MLNNLIIEKCIRVSDPISITDYNQVDKLITVFESLIGEQDFFFQQQQRTELKELLEKSLNNKPTLNQVLHKIAGSDNKKLTGIRAICQNILNEKHGVKKLSFLLS